MLRPSLLAVALALSAVTALAADAPNVAVAPERLCRAPIRGSITTTLTTESCPSPLGICYEGTLRTNSPLRGETFFVVESIGTDTEGNVTYTGTLFVTLASGVVVEFASSGVLDPQTLQFTETDVLVAPDGSPLAATLTFTGTASPGLAGFTGQVTGEICGVTTLLKG